MSNVVITSGGINSVHAAHDSGPLIAIKYFLPIFDFRCSPELHNGSDTIALNVSACMSASDSTPFGEIIYNIDPSGHAYSLSTTDTWIVSAGTETVTKNGTTWTVVNSVQSKQQMVNLYDDVPLTDSIYGSDVSFSATSNAWTVLDSQEIKGVNTVPTETSSGRLRYFAVTDYYPVTDGDTIRGSFKCRLSGQLGKFKFNKVALYSVKINPDGSETVDDPVLFAEAGIDNPIVKTNFGSDGFDDIVIDAQVILHSVAANWSEVFFSTSGDYWSRTPGGLYYPEKVGIGTFQDSVQEPQAKLEIKTSTCDQLRLSYNDSQYAGFNLSSAGVLLVSATGSQISSLCNIIPTGTKNLGSTTSEWSSLYVDNLRTNYFSTDINLYSNLKPGINNTYDLGALGKWFNDAYLYDIHVGNDIVPSANNESVLGDYTHAYAGLWTRAIASDDGNLAVSSNLIPVGADLGSSSLRWNAGYFSNVNSLSASIGQLSVVDIDSVSTTGGIKSGPLSVVTDGFLKWKIISISTNLNDYFYSSTGTPGDATTTYRITLDADIVPAAIVGIDFLLRKNATNDWYAPGNIVTQNSTFSTAMFANNYELSVHQANTSDFYIQILVRTVATSFYGSTNLPFRCVIFYY